jgi:8-oxo-dGTP diphosphatase
MDREVDFHGAKIALFVEDQLLVYRRDDFTTIPFPNMLDLPGGGREDGESGAQCVVRETEEEFGIKISLSAVEFVEQYPNWRGSGAQALFFVGRLSKDQVAKIEFGDEGQDWQLMAVSDYLSSKEAIPHLQGRLREYIDRQ